MLDTVTHETFEPLIGQKFTLSTPEQTQHQFELTYVEQLPIPAAAAAPEQSLPAARRSRSFSSVNRCSRRPSIRCSTIRWAASR